ncbi:MAG: EF-hand domain-containing protein [Syntrophorhabdaceae bacterium]|nr:EF-hand domain-containing protein [Syntrophorhabdaceae bacterium]
MISSISSMNSSLTSMVQMRQQMFSKIDTNGDGKHDADELAQIVANGPQGGPGVEDILTQFDTDGDGSISESEFSAADPGASASMGGAGAMSTADFIKEMFGQMDENEDGTIDADELEQMAAMGPKGGPGAEELLAELDANGDGSVSEAEFSEGARANQQVQGPPPPPPPPAQDESGTESIFSLLDTDGDGTISETEFDTAMSQIDNFIASSSSQESVDTMNGVMQMLGSALNAYQASSSSDGGGSYMQASQYLGSSLYA